MLEFNVHDRVHLVALVPQKISIFELIGSLKDRTRIPVLHKYPELGKKRC